MNTNIRTPRLSAAAEQTKNNTTSWIGHLRGVDDHIVRGQTFSVNQEGDLASIEIYSNVVAAPGKVLMSVHTYDPQTKSWGPVLASTTVEFKSADNEKWMSFNLPGLHLDKGKTYGFRMETGESLIGIGEAAGSANQPLSGTGQEWEFKGNSKKGNAFSYFSLAFKIGIRA